MNNRLRLLLLPFLFLLLFSIYPRPIAAQFECPPGMEWSRQDSSDNPWLYILSPGSANNIFDDSRYACGGYQDMVLNWLERVRSSPDTQTRELLEGFDFGPIQIAAGGHPGDQCHSYEPHTGDGVRLDLP